MTVTACDIPANSVLSRDLIERADFWDSYRAPVSYKKLGVVDIFFAIFAHRPQWMTQILIARNKAAAFVGLEVPTTAEIRETQIKDRYAVGDKIGPWPIFFLDENELVAGRNNRHMDFRLSLIKVPDGDRMNVVVSTICTVHNTFGRCYLFCIIPFHRHGVQLLIANAVASRRL